MQEIEGNISISSLKENHPQFTLLLPPMLSSFNTLVSWGKATVGTDRNIVNVGDFAQYNDGTGSVCMSRYICVCFGCTLFYAYRQQWASSYAALKV